MLDVVLCCVLSVCCVVCCVVLCCVYLRRNERELVRYISFFTMRKDASIKNEQIASLRKKKKTLSLFKFI